MIVMKRLSRILLMVSVLFIADIITILVLDMIYLLIFFNDTGQAWLLLPIASVRLFFDSFLFGVICYALLILPSFFKYIKVLHVMSFVIISISSFLFSLSNRDEDLLFVIQLIGCSLITYAFLKGRLQPSMEDI